MMKITRISALSGIKRTLDIDVKQAQLDEYNKGESLIQIVFPMLSIEDREFIKSGITGKEWDEIFKENDDKQEYEL